MSYALQTCSIFIFTSVDFTSQPPFVAENRKRTIEKVGGYYELLFDVQMFIM